MAGARPRAVQPVAPGRDARPAQDRRCCLHWKRHRPAEQAVASWRAVRPGLTPHGLRHGHRTWLDDLGVQETLKSERMGHDVPGMAGVYGHIMPEWRNRLRSQLQ